GRAGMLGFLGCAGLPLERIYEQITDVKTALHGRDVAWGANLIHSPQEPGLEERVVELLLREGVRHVEASAFMALRPSVAWYAYRGIRLDDRGRIQRPNRLLVNLSRPEVASAFLAPAPVALLHKLVAEGKLSPEEGRLGAHLPVAEDVTAEAD